MYKKERSRPFEETPKALSGGLFAVYNRKM